MNEIEQLAVNLRAGFVEYLEVTSCYSAQRKYQEAVPWVHVPFEIICMWEDISPEPPVRCEFLRVVFSERELEALQAFHEVWDRTSEQDATPELSVLQVSPAWTELRDAADQTLRVLVAADKLGGG